MTDFPTGFILSTILKASNLDLCGNLEPTPGNFLLLGPGRPSRGRRGIKKLPNERFHEFFAITYKLLSKASLGRNETERHNYIVFVFFLSFFLYFFVFFVLNTFSWTLHHHPDCANHPGKRFDPGND